MHWSIFQREASLGLNYVLCVLLQHALCCLLVRLLTAFLVCSICLLGCPMHGSVTIAYHDEGLVQALPVQRSDAETGTLELGLS